MYMKTYLSKALVILIASVAVGVDGAPPGANVSLVGGAMNPGAPSGGRCLPEWSAERSVLAIFWDRRRVSALPTWRSMALRAELFILVPNGIFPNRTIVTGGGPLAAPGGTLSGGGVGGVKSSVIVAGGTLTAGGTGGTLIVGGVGGVKSSVIVAGGTPTAGGTGGTLSGSGVGGVKSNVIVAGGTLTAGGTGGTLTPGAVTGSAHSVTVTGGSTH